MIFRFFVLLSLTSLGAPAQSVDSVMIDKGIDKFLLGAPISQFQKDLGYIRGGQFTWNDTTTYTYAYCPLENSPIQLNGITFRSLMLTFLNNINLHSFEFFSMYADKPTAALKKMINGNQRRAKKDYQSLVSYMNTKWGKAGRRTVYDKLSYHSTYEWTSPTSIMQLSLQYSFKDPRKFTTISFSLRAIPPQ